MVNEMFDPINPQEREMLLEQRRSLLSPEFGLRRAREEAGAIGSAPRELLEGQAGRIARIEAQESLSSRYQTDFDIQEREKLLEQRRSLLAQEPGVRWAREDARTLGAGGRESLEGRTGLIARFEAQESLFSRHQTDYFKDIPGFGDAFRQTRYELGQASEFARAHTGRPGIVYTTGGFHGLTCGALSLMANPFWKERFRSITSGHRGRALLRSR